MPMTEELPPKPGLNEYADSLAGLATAVPVGVEPAPAPVTRPMIVIWRAVLFPTVGVVLTLFDAAGKMLGVHPLGYDDKTIPLVGLVALCIGAAVDFGYVADARRFRRRGHTVDGYAVAVAGLIACLLLIVAKLMGWAYFMLTYSGPTVIIEI